MSEGDSRAAAERALTAAAEHMARKFHEHYEALAPSFGYKTREESAVPWDEVPVQNKALMVATCLALMSEVFGGPKT